jgi:MarR family transcriptional regulator, organic hydroperoxide resistance regulator
VADAERDDNLLPQDSADHLIDRAVALKEFIRAGKRESRLAALARIAVSSAVGVTPSDMIGLEFLYEQGSATAGELATQTNLTTGAITSMIRRLERDGFLIAERDDGDRRRVVLTPLRDGEDRGMQDYTPFAEAMEDLVASYSTEELVFLARHQQRMADIYAAQIERVRASS